MIPILYKATETCFDSNGIGHLTDCLLCEVTEERNGAFELQLRYPLQGRYFAELKKHAIIKARADLLRMPQLFRIYRRVPVAPGELTVYARHISYDLLGMPVAPFTAASPSEAMAGLKTYNAAPDCSFTFETDVSNLGTFTNPVPASARACLGGIDGSILETYGGELEFDNYTVRLHEARGRDNGVSIRYGKNLISLKQDENCAAVYAGVYPYWTRKETMDDEPVTTYVELPEKVILRSGATEGNGILPLDLSDAFDETPTEEQLRAAANVYIDEHNLFVPEVSITVDFALLWQTEEYKHIAELEYVSLCDTVGVYFPQLDVLSRTKVVKTVFDVLRDRYKSVTLGTIKQTVADTLAAQNSALKSLDADRIKNSLNATDINLYGSFNVRNGDTLGGRMGFMSGMTGDGTVTNGIGVRNADGSCTIIVTDAGVSMRSGDGSVFVSDGHASINGATMSLLGKNVSWQENEDGTWTLIGT